MKPHRSRVEPAPFVSVMIRALPWLLALTSSLLVAGCFYGLRESHPAASREVYGRRVVSVDVDLTNLTLAEYTSPVRIERDRLLERLEAGLAHGLGEGRPPPSSAHGDMRLVFAPGRTHRTHQDNDYYVWLDGFVRLMSGDTELAALEVHYKYTENEGEELEWLFYYWATQVGQFLSRYR